MRRSIATLLVLFAAAACAKQDKPAAAPGAFKSVGIGDASPAFTVATIGGDSAHVGGAARQPVTFVNIWASFVA